MTRRDDENELVAILLKAVKNWKRSIEMNDDTEHDDVMPPANTPQPKHVKDMTNVEAEVAEGILLGVDRARKQQRIEAAMLAQAMKD